MTNGVLLDTHALLWLRAGALMDARAILAIARASASNRLFASHITIWEIGVATGKKNAESRPDLGGLAPGPWFRTTTAKTGVRSVGISALIAEEAAIVPGIYGSGDPGDCFLIATARVRRLSLVTRDTKMIALAQRERGYLDVIVC